MASVGHTIPWGWLSLEGVHGKFVSLTRSFYLSSCSRVWTYGDVSTVYVRFICFVFLFIFVVEMIVDIAPSSYENDGTGGCSDRDLSGFKYADGVVLLSEDLKNLHNFHESLIV